MCVYDPPMKRQAAGSYGPQNGRSLFICLTARPQRLIGDNSKALLYRNNRINNVSFLMGLKGSGEVE